MEVASLSSIGRSEDDDYLVQKSCSFESRLNKRQRLCSLDASWYELHFLTGSNSSVDPSPEPAPPNLFTPVGCFNCSKVPSDVISTIDYDETNELVATGGLARKVRICSYKVLLNSAAGNFKRDLFTTICTPAKLSSIKWGSGSCEVIGCGDYDGSVTEWDVEYGTTVSERYDHSGKTVWSIDYSSQQGLMASASSDGTVRFWSRKVESNVGCIKSSRGNSMCSAEFSSSMYIAVGCADTSVYIYDLRDLSRSVFELRGHQRSVGYVRWMGQSRLVSSSPDGSIKLWDLTSSSSEPVRSFGAHSNRRNFVGLSVSPETGLIACGSETNEVFVYDISEESPVLQQGFRTSVDTSPFVASVCWMRHNGIYSLISANSEGILQLIKVHSA